VSPLVLVHVSELNELVRATAFTSFLLLGFLEIGQEMYVFTFTQPPPPILKGRSENPFNYDLNDLDLDGFCLALQRDLHEITAVSLLTGQNLIFLILTSPRSILALSPPMIMSSRPGTSRLPLLTGDLRKRL